MADYTVPDVFNKDKALNRVKFGRDTTLLDIELDEMQKILQYKVEKSNQAIVKDGFLNKNAMTLTSGTLTVPVDTVFVNGKLIEILEPMTLAGLTTADKVYLSVWEEVVTSAMTLKKGGNQSGGTNISNADVVDAAHGSETARRVQQKVQLVKTNTDTSRDYLLLATLTGATTFTDNRPKIAVNVLVNPASVLQDASNRFFTDTERTKLTGIATGANNYVHPASHPPSIITQDASNRFFTDAERNKLSGIEAGATNYSHPATHPASMITEDTTRRFVADTKIAEWNAKETPDNAQTKANTAETNAKNHADGKFTALHGGAPVVLDTLKKIATSIASDADFAGTMTTELAKKITPAGVDAKVTAHEEKSDIHTNTTEKAAWNGKAEKTPATTTTDGLMASTDKVKLNGIETGANNYSHPATHPATMITEDSTHRFATDAEKTTWNGKASTAVATTTANGLMASTDKVKLNGVETGANNYSHPATHPPAIIAQDASNRFVTDTEKTTWNAKAPTTLATSSVNGLMPSTDKAKLDAFTVVSAPAANAVLKLDAASKLPASITGNADGNAATATKLQTARTLSLTGDVTGSVSFDGSGNAAIAATYKNSGVAAGTYPKVTVDTKGNVTAGANLAASDIPALDYSKITTGKPTTVAELGVTDLTSTPKKSRTLPNVAGWYRIAETAVDISRPHGTFIIDWTLSGVHGRAIVEASLLYGMNPVLNQLLYANYNNAASITKARIVYATAYTGKVAYLEVYSAGANALTLDITLEDSNEKWFLVDPASVAIPAGHLTKELDLQEGFATTGQISSQAATGLAPLKILSTTVVPNLNADMIDGSHAGTAANNVLKLDATGKASPTIIAQNSTNRFVTDAEKTDWNSKETAAEVMQKIEQTSYNMTRSGKDADGIFTTVEHRRSTDNTLAVKAVMSGGTAPLYTTRTITYYGTNGTTVEKTEVFALTYDADDDLQSEVKV